MNSIVIFLLPYVLCWPLGRRSLGFLLFGVTFTVQHGHNLVGYTNEGSSVVCLVWVSETCGGPPGNIMLLICLGIIVSVH